MEVVRRGFSSLISDNEENYLSQFLGVVESSDELCCVEISKTPHSLHFRIAPSTSNYINSLIHEINKFNNLFGIRVNMSKSIKTSSVITFNIETL